MVDALEVVRTHELNSSPSSPSLPFRNDANRATGSVRKNFSASAAAEFGSWIGNTQGYFMLAATVIALWASMAAPGPCVPWLDVDALPRTRACTLSL